MDVLLASLLYIWLAMRRRRKATSKKRVRRFKARPVFRQRQSMGEMIIMKEIYLKDSDLFKKSFRMTTKQFDYILGALEPFISKGRANWNDSISARQRLAMTLR